MVPSSSGMKTQKARNVVVILLVFSHVLYVQALSPAGTIERITKQQLLASIPPSHESTPTGSSKLFLTSPSGKYAVFLLRRETSIGAGGFGSDFCYIQVQESSESVWESECTVVSNENTCSLVFSDAGLEIFDGSRSVWDGDVEDDDAHLAILELMDSGDMQIRNKEGELSWKASDSPLANQNCGSIGAPGLSPAHPPFGSPIHRGNGPFGQQVSGTGNQGQQLSGTGNQGQQISGVGSPGSTLAFPPPEEQVQGEQGSQGQQLSGTDAPGSPLALPPQEEQDQDDDQGGPEELSDSTLQHQDINHPFSAAVNQPFGVGNQHQQPLVDNTPFDSGSTRMKPFNSNNLQIGLVSLHLAFLAYFALFLF